MQLFRADHIRSHKGLRAIQEAIMSGGPVETGMTVYEDFYSYVSGVYIYTYGGYVGEHAVKILGWGATGTLSYWICANSWGTSWGESGYFNIEFGQCGIDQEAYSGIPVLN